MTEWRVEAGGILHYSGPNMEIAITEAKKAADLHGYSQLHGEQNGIPVHVTVTPQPPAGYNLRQD